MLSVGETLQRQFAHIDRQWGAQPRGHGWQLCHQGLGSKHFGQRVDQPHGQHHQHIGQVARLRAQQREDGPGHSGHLHQLDWDEVRGVIAPGGNVEWSLGRKRGLGL